jgi:hypothetical protein
MYDLYHDQRAEGEVLLDGENILSPTIDLTLLRSRIGMAFQKPTPFPMSIYDNFAFDIKLFEKIGRSALDGRVEEALRGAAGEDAPPAFLIAPDLNVVVADAKVSAENLGKIKPGDSASFTVAAIPDHVFFRRSHGDQSVAIAVAPE